MLKVKEDTDGMKGYCQGHSIFDKVVEEIKEFKMAKLEMEKDFFQYAKSNCESGYNFKNVYAEISEENYWYMLEVLPPLKMQNSFFLMSEFNKGKLVNGACKCGGKYYVFTIDVNDWKNAGMWMGKNL